MTQQLLDTPASTCATVQPWNLTDSVLSLNQLYNLYWTARVTPSKVENGPSVAPLSSVTFLYGKEMKRGKYKSAGERVQNTRFGNGIFNIKQTNQCIFLCLISLINGPQPPHSGLGSVLLFQVPASKFRATWWLPSLATA